MSSGKKERSTVVDIIVIDAIFIFEITFVTNAKDTVSTHEKDDKVDGN